MRCRFRSLHSPLPSLRGWELLASITPAALFLPSIPLAFLTPVAAMSFWLLTIPAACSSAGGALRKHVALPSQRGTAPADLKTNHPRSRTVTHGPGAESPSRSPRPWTLYARGRHDWEVRQNPETHDADRDTRRSPGRMPRSKLTDFDGCYVRVKSKGCRTPRRFLSVQQGPQRLRI
jgi:hypothetical protein